MPDVRFGSLADISQCNHNVRFTPEDIDLPPAKGQKRTSGGKTAQAVRSSGDNPGFEER